MMKKKIIIELEGEYTRNEFKGLLLNGKFMNVLSNIFKLLLDTEVKIYDEEIYNIVEEDRH